MKVDTRFSDAAHALQCVGDARRQGDALRALKLAADAEAAFPGSAAIIFEHAEALNSAGQRDNAEAAYRRTLAADPTHVGALVGCARSRRQHGDYASAAALLRTAAEHRPQNAGILAELAFSLWQLMDVGEAEVIYHRVLEIDPGQPGALAGLARVARHANDHAAAAALFQRALDRRAGDRGLREELGRSLTELNRLDEAAKVFQSIVDETPSDARILAALARVHRLRGDAAAAVELLRAAAAAAETPQLHLTIGITLLELDQPEASESAFQSALRLAPRFAPALLQLGMRARARGDDAAALSWFTQAADADPDDPSYLFEVAVALADLERHAESEALLARVDAMPGAAAHDRLRLRRLEQYCKNLQLDAALDCLATFGPVPGLPTRTVAWAAALHAARGDWNAVLRVFAERVVPGVGADRVPAADILLEAVGRAARATWRQAEVLGLLDAWQAAGTPAVASLREQLAEEAMLLHAVRPGMPAPAAAPATPLRAARSARLAGLLAVSVAPVVGTIFLCSDRNYLPGTLVALSSLLRHNRAALRHCRFCVFLSQDALEVAQPMVQRLAAAYNLPIETVPDKALEHACTGLRIDYATFSPGHKLSEAAYYRILAALWLAADGQPGHAVYIDSDICAGPGFAGLLRLDLAGRPLSARAEESCSLPIRRAARKLGIAPTDYFNSGVLIFDLRHEAAVASLRQAFELAVKWPERLSFHDQCALNLAFHGQVTKLPDIFNQYVRHQTDLAALPSDAPVVHYLGRPKPWDPAYGTANGNRWLEEFYALADVLDVEQMRTLLAMQFVKEVVLF